MRSISDHCDTCPTCGSKRALAPPPPPQYVPADQANVIFDKARLHSVAEAATLLGVSPHTVRGWMYRGLLKAERSGPKRVFIRGADLEQMLDVAYRLEPRKPSPRGR